MAAVTLLLFELWSSSQGLMEEFSPAQRSPQPLHRSQTNRKAKGAGVELGQGRQSSLPPPLHTGTGDIFSLASWFCPQSCSTQAAAATPALEQWEAERSWDLGEGLSW